MQLLDTAVMPKIQRKIEPRLWKALRCAKLATEQEPVLRLMLATNKPP